MSDARDTYCTGRRKGPGSVSAGLHVCRAPSTVGPEYQGIVSAPLVKTLAPVMALTGIEVTRSMPSRAAAARRLPTNSSYVA